MKPEERIKEIEKKITIQGLMDAPGSILVGLGLYAKFAANGDAFHPILNNATVVNVMLAVGVSIMLWGGYNFIKLTSEKTRITNEYNL